MRYRIQIVYCPKCRWMLRSAWYAQELLETFGERIEEVALAPDHESPGQFVVRVGGTVVWDRSADGGFPEAKVLKQRVRDLVEPDRDLGHSERGGKGPGAQGPD